MDDMIEYIEPENPEIEDCSHMFTGQPLKPTVRCKRCGCWLRAERVDPENPDEELPPREYCSACERHLILKSQPCLKCGNLFAPKTDKEQRCPKCEAEYQRNKQVCKQCGVDFLPYSCVTCKGKPEIHDLCPTCHWRILHTGRETVHERICRVCGSSFLPRTCIVPGCKQKLTDICPICHEETECLYAPRQPGAMEKIKETAEALQQASANADNTAATVWELPDCPRCHKVITALEGRGRKILCLDLRKLISGEERNIAAMTHLAMSGGAAPLVLMDGKFLEVREIDALIAPKEQS